MNLALTAGNERDAARILAEESVWRDGIVPESLDDPLVKTVTLSLSYDSVLLHFPNDVKFFYKKGQAVSVFRPPGFSDSEVKLFINGSLYGIIALLNGFIPLQASAVVHKNLVHAFVGYSGAGKSVTAASLNQIGMPLFCDDVLVLDVRCSKIICCVPGPRDLYLRRSGLELLGNLPGNIVRKNVDRFEVSPNLTDTKETLQLGTLFYLRDPNILQSEINAIKGIDRLRQLQKSIIRLSYAEKIFSNQFLFSSISRIASFAPAYRLSNSWQAGNLHETIANLDAFIKKDGLSA